MRGHPEPGRYQTLESQGDGAEVQTDARSLNTGSVRMNEAIHFEQHRAVAEPCRVQAVIGPRLGLGVFPGRPASGGRVPGLYCCQKPGATL